MTEIVDALRKALRDLCRPQVLIMVAVPILFATAVWLFIGWLFWARLTEWINGVLLTSTVGQWIAGWAQGALQFLGSVIALALLAPGILITAMLITEFFTMPGLVNFVAQHDYPTLERRHGGTITSGAINSVVAIVIFAVLWLVTLPLWFTGIGALLVPLVNTAYLNQRIFRHDAAAAHASSEELRALIRHNRRGLFLLGLVLALFLYVPFVNLLAPALTGLAYTHYQLNALARLRGSQPDTRAPRLR